MKVNSEILLKDEHRRDFKIQKKIFTDNINFLRGRS